VKFIHAEWVSVHTSVISTRRNVILIGTNVYEAHERDFYMPSVISIRTSVLSTLTSVYMIPMSVTKALSSEN
jgi:hypothetical protein